MMENKILVAKNVTKIYGVGTKNPYTALSDVSLEMYEGEFVCVMGPSGAGKSTFINNLSTIDIPTKGFVYINGKEVRQMSEGEIGKFRYENLGFIFQEFNLLDTFSVKDNIFLPLVLSKESYPEMNQKLKTLAPQLGIENLLEKYPYEISGGQKQRVACARAIVTNPDLILADEPTGALDSKSARMLLDSLNALNEKLNATILMVTHDSFTASYADRVIFIKDGKIFNEIVKGDNSRKMFFNSIMDVQTLLGGELNEVI